MVMNLDGALGLHAQALNVRTERAKVLASNLANIDTPGFKAKDIDFKALLQGIQDTQKSGHAGQGFSAPDVSSFTKFRVPMQASVDGNTAELGVEQAAFNSNAMDYQMSLTFLNNKIKGLNKAIDGR